MSIVALRSRLNVTLLPVAKAYRGVPEGDLDVHRHWICLELVGGGEERRVVALRVARLRERPEVSVERARDDARACDRLPTRVGDPAGQPVREEDDGRRRGSAREGRAAGDQDRAVRELLRPHVAEAVGRVEPTVRAQEAYGVPPIWDGLGLLEYAFVPHVASPGHPQTEARDRLAEHYRTEGVPHRTLRDGQALVIDGETTR